MIRVTLPDRTVVLTFVHPSTDTTEERRPGRASICKIFQLGKNTTDKTLLAEGRTECSKQDNFSKAVGRKIAIRRALCNHDITSCYVGRILGIPKHEARCWKCGVDISASASRPHNNYFSKEERREIWRVYHRIIWGLEQFD